MPSTSIAAEPDRYETRAGSAPSSKPAPRTESPFAAMAARAETRPPTRRLSEVAIPPEMAIDLPPEVLSILTRLEVGAGVVKGVERAVVGTMLLAAEGGPVPGIQSVAEKVVQGNQKAAREAFARWLETSERALALTRENVAALVQRVLRESYLLGTEILRDHANEVRRHNETKKKVRELLEKAREAKSTWATEARALGEGQPFVADPPFALVEVDAATGELFTPPMTEEDVRRREAVASERASQSAVADFERVYGGSQLTAAELAELDEMVRDKDEGIEDFFDSENDDYIRDNIDTLTAIVPRMNQEELEAYFVPIVRTLAGGNSDEEETLAMFRALTPVQYLYLGTGLERSELEDPRGRYEPKVMVTRTGLDSSGRSEVGLAFAQAARSVAQELGLELPDPVSEKDMARLLAALAARGDGSEMESSDAGAAVGSPRTATTLDELDTYIERLEEQLNGIGDDAQLANVDLQNQLQRQQQVLQMMSNMAKVLHETAMAIVRKVGA